MHYNKTCSVVHCIDFSFHESLCSFHSHPIPPEKWTDCMILSLFKNTEREALCCHTKTKQFCVSKQFEAHTQTIEERVCSVQQRASAYITYTLAAENHYRFWFCVCVQTRLHTKNHTSFNTHAHCEISESAIAQYINNGKKKGPEK